MAKYDWTKLKTEYVTGSFGSLKDFAAAKGVPYTLTRQRAKGWNEEKRTRTEQKANKITELTIEKQIESESEINTQHYELWREFVKKAKVLMETAETANQVKTLAEVIEKAQKGQRLARGMDADKPPTGSEVRPINIIFKDTRRKDEGG